MFDGINRHDLVLVTGGTGTLGQALIPELLKKTDYVRVMSRDEAKQGELARTFPVEVMLGDVRDPVACRNAVREVDFIIHAASLKYVDVSEQQPSEYVKTNVVGTMNLIDAVFQEKTVRHVVGISTDKACAPFNTYGLTKGLLEKLFVEAHLKRGGAIDTIFNVCRYGNVIGSRGSVVLKWQELAQQGKKIQVTDPDMTRFFFTIDDALNLIDSALMSGFGIFSQAMPSCTIGALASLWGEYDVVGRRPGEKAHEDLLSTHEMPRVARQGDLFIYNPLRDPDIDPTPGLAYTSDTARRMSRVELDAMTLQWRT